MQNRNELATEVDYDRKTIRNTVDSLAKTLAGTYESLETLENGLSPVTALADAMDEKLASDVSLPGYGSPLNIDLARILEGLVTLQRRIEYLHQRVDL